MTTATPRDGAQDPRFTSPPPPGDSPSYEHRVDELAERGGARAGEKLGQARRSGAEKIDALADSARAAADSLERSELGPLSDYVERMAGSMTRLSSDLREKTGDQLLHDVGRIARDNPALFITGGVAIGFGLSRFAKASAEHPHRRSEGADSDSEGQAVAMPSGQTFKPEQAGEVKR